MQKLIDKLVLFGLCLLAFSFGEIMWLSIMTMLGAVAVSSLCSYFENRLTALLCLGYALLCLALPEFIVFLPLVVYDSAGLSGWPLRFCWAPALFVGFFTVAPFTMIASTLSSGVAILLQYRTASQISARDKYIALTDSAKERAESLERKNRDLMEKQDYEVRLATLAERNRIAREIHDNVGHLLTRSLLQMSALRVTHSGDGGLTDELDLVKGTLSDAMDTIRSSVHDLHSESVDLRSRLEALVDGFGFCPVKLRYDAGELPVEVRYCFDAIARESLSNVARHSNATEATISVTEHPAFYQLLVSDNGAVKATGVMSGIGLQNMADRVDALGGVFRVDKVKGFRVFISIPKGPRVEDSA